MKLLLLLLLTLSSLCNAKPAPNIQLAKNFSEQPIIIEHYWVSEKLDGIRGYWTGNKLLTRQGNLITPPAWFTNNWPTTAMDGELWFARNKFEQTLSCVSKKQADEHCWRKLSFMIFDLPTSTANFDQRVQLMQKIINQTANPHLNMIKQVKLTSLTQMQQLLDEVTAKQGEGLMLHHQAAHYKNSRSDHLLKVKKRHDAEAVVIAHIAGKGKFTGMLGAIKVKTPEGIIFKIGTGFSDTERSNPPAIGSTITYQYLSKTKNGVPRFASFLRIRAGI